LLLSGTAELSNSCVHSLLPHGIVSGKEERPVLTKILPVTPTQSAGTCFVHLLTIQPNY